ncbi:MAG: hypothetical protein FWE08_01530 [Oscillospiraceae bacterium]|nr:hypothetical protein [Oscillospiraceae bacterium]
MKNGRKRYIAFLLAVVLLTTPVVFAAMPTEPLVYQDIAADGTMATTGTKLTANNFNVRYLPGGCWPEFNEGIFVITTSSELSRSGLPAAVTEPYSDEFFDTHYLVVVSNEEGSGCHRLHVDSINANGDITIQRRTPSGDLRDHAVLAYCH